MDFELNEHQIELKNHVRKFAEKELLTAAANFDNKVNPKDCVPTDLIKKALDMNLGSACIPENYGGTGMSNLDLTIISEELARGDIGFSSTIMANVHGAHSLLKFGTEEQKQKWLTRIAKNESGMGLMAVGLTEPDSGGDAMSPDPNSGMKTFAELDGDEYVLNGRKCFITNGGLADIYLIWARTDRSKGAPAGGLSVFIVTPDTPGFSIGKIEDKMGQRLSQQSELIFEDCRIPKENILGQEGMGFQICMSMAFHSFVMVGAMSVGLADKAFEHAYSYAKQRVQGGMPIVRHQAISLKLADMLIQIESARSLIRQTARALDAGIMNMGHSQMCKVLGSDIANRIATEVVQIFGGYGYMKEYPVEKLMRDAKVLQIYESGNETHRHHIIMGRLFAEEAQMQNR